MAIPVEVVLRYVAHGPAVRWAINRTTATHLVYRVAWSAAS